MTGRLGRSNTAGAVTACDSGRRYRFTVKSPFTPMRGVKLRPHLPEADGFPSALSVMRVRRRKS